jgi:hypothetical protein
VRFLVVWTYSEFALTQRSIDFMSAALLGFLGSCVLEVVTVRIQSPSARTLCALVSTALIAGCYGNHNVSGIPAASKYAMSTTQNIVWPTSVPTKPQVACNSLPNILHVSQFLNNTVNIYNNPQNQGNPPPIVTITASQGLNGPAGMIVAPNSTILYVANYNASNVLLFKKCGTGPGAKLLDAPTFRSTWPSTRQRRQTRTFRISQLPTSRCSPPVA